MRLPWKLKHTLLAALPYTSIAVCLIVVLLFPVPNNEEIAFLLGIAASVIATLITKIIDNFSQGRKMILKIDELSQKFVDYFNDIIKTEGFISQEHIYNMLQINYEMCYSCEDVFISKEYKKLRFAMAKVVSDIKKYEVLEKIEHKIGAVVTARENLKF